MLTSVNSRRRWYIDSSYLLRKAIMREVLKGVNLRKSFGGVHAVNDVSLEFKENEVCSIVGPNGAGKTTLINVLTDFLPLDAGSLFFMGEDISNLPKIARIKLGIARSFQTPALFENLTAIDNLRLAIFAQMGKVEFFYRYKNMACQVKVLSYWKNLKSQKIG
jgi:ABC-type branched-subunit amino acid transport system ATPase component